MAVVVRPDATVISRAMTASTIAEVFVEEDEVRVEIEIGVARSGPANAGQPPGSVS